MQREDHGLNIDLVGEMRETLIFLLSELHAFCHLFGLLVLSSVILDVAGFFAFILTPRILPILFFLLFCTLHLTLAAFAYYVISLTRWTYRTVKKKSTGRSRVMTDEPEIIAYENADFERVHQVERANLVAIIDGFGGGVGFFGILAFAVWWLYGPEQIITKALPRRLPVRGTISLIDLVFATRLSNITAGLSLGVLVVFLLLLPLVGCYFLLLANIRSIIARSVAVAETTESISALQYLIKELSGAWYILRHTGGELQRQNQKIARSFIWGITKLLVFMSLFWFLVSQMYSL